MQIFVKNFYNGSSKTLTLEVEGDFTFARIKELIRDKIGGFTCQMRLSFHGHIFDRGLEYKTLQDFNIFRESTLDVSVISGHICRECYPAVGELFVNLFGGETLILNVRIFDDSVTKIKEMIEEKTGIPIERQLLLSPQGRSWIFPIWDDEKLSSRIRYGKEDPITLLKKRTVLEVANASGKTLSITSWEQFLGACDIDDGDHTISGCFKENGIQLKQILSLTEDDLKEIGIKMGPRKLILDYLKTHCVECKDAITEDDLKGVVDDTEDNLEAILESLITHNVKSS